MNKFERKLSGKRVVRAGRRFTLFTPNKDSNDTINVIKSLEDSSVIIGGVTETVKYEINKQECWFPPALLAPLAASLVLPVISSVVKGVSGRGVRRTRKGYIDKKLLVPLNLLSNVKITKCLNYKPRFNDVFSRN